MINALMQNPFSAIGLVVIGGVVIAMLKSLGGKKTPAEPQSSLPQIQNPFEPKPQKAHTGGVGVLDALLLVALVFAVSVGSEKLPEGNPIRTSIDRIYDVLPDNPPDNISNYLLGGDLNA